MDEGDAVKFDADQLAAIMTSAPRVLVVAGPGSGKTTTLIGRVRYMVEQMRISPGRIVCLSFTRYATSTVRARLPATCSGVHATTLHSFCLRLLMEYGSNLGYERNWLSIATDEDIELDEREVLSDLGIIRKTPRGKWTWRKASKKSWDALKMGLTSGTITDKQASETMPDLYPAWVGTLSRLRAQNVLTFGTILYEAYTLLQDRKVLMHYRERFNHFLIDEFQDTSHVQFSIIMRLVEAASPQTLWMCGDVRQSLYSWRAASPDIMRAEADKDATTVYPLANCYRFGKNIARPANALIAHNPSDCIGGDIKPRGATDGEFVVSEDTSLDETADQIQETITAGVEPQDIAVLCRQHAPLDALHTILKRRGVPCRKLGTIKALRGRAEFRAIMGYIRLAVNPYDRSAFMAVTATEGLSESAILKLREKAFLENTSLYAAYGHAETFPKTLDEVRTYIAKTDPLGEYGEAIEYLLVFCHSNGCVEPWDIVEAIGLYSVQDELRTLGNEVRLATVHCMKGAEADYVWFIGMNEGVSPSQQSVNNDNLDEETRVAFVGVTRAKIRMVCHHSILDGVMRYNTGPSKPSRFLAWMEEDA